MKLYLFNALLIIVISACVRNTGAQVGKVFETYYVGDGINQYFVSPLKFKNDEMKFECDFTYRDKRDSVTFNYSIYSQEPIAKFDYIAFNKGTDQVELDEIQKLFIEKYRKDFHSRFTSKMSRKDFIKLFHSDSFNISFKSEGSEMVLKPKSKTLKSKKVVEENMIRIIELELD